MRTVKFRGWSLDLKGWVYGACYEHCACAVCFAEDDKPEYHEAKIIFEQMVDWGFPYRTMVTDVVKESVGECAGKMPDGKEIYEGDIVQRNDIPSDVGVVRYGDYPANNCCKRSGFYIDWLAGNSIEQELVSWLKDIQIIGNMYENPELIEKFIEEIERYGEAEK